MDAQQAKKLREPFKPAQIGKLPKPTKRENPKGRCGECGGWHGLPAVHLDYVGHAAITDRLLEVDPGWTWEPMARDPHGFPLLDQRGGLWILLTVCGVTRPGYGDETNGKGMKEIIGDALRNAAMRFGVGLDLWSKEDLRGDDDDRPDGDVGNGTADVAAAVAAAILRETDRLLALSAELGADRDQIAASIEKNRLQHGDEQEKHLAWLARQAKTAEQNVETKKKAAA